MTDPDVVDNADEGQYELRVDGRLAGLVLYRRHGNAITMIHTEVQDGFEGQGIGGRIAKAVLDDARAHGWRVLAQCPFIRSYIERHPDYRDLTT